MHAYNILVATGESESGISKTETIRSHGWGPVGARKKNLLNEQPLLLTKTDRFFLPTVLRVMTANDRRFS